MSAPLELHKAIPLLLPFCKPFSIFLKLRILQIKQKENVVSTKPPTK